MSRTRIVGGVYTKITGGDYKMYTEGDTIITAAGRNDFANAEKVIFGDKPERYASKNTISNIDDPKTEIDYKFLIYFNRGKEYKGEYGFDWMRREYIEPIEKVKTFDGKKKRTICSNPEKLKEKYISFDRFKIRYYCPWVSIFPSEYPNSPHKEGIDLHIEIFDDFPENKKVKKNNNIKILFESENLDINITSNSEKLNELRKINIRCGEISDISVINVKAILSEGESVKINENIGRLYLYPNKDIKKINLYMINCLINDGNMKILDKKLFNIELEKYLNTYVLNQFLTQCEVKSYEYFDLRKHRNQEGQTLIEKYQLNKEPYVKELKASDNKNYKFRVAGNEIRDIRIFRDDLLSLYETYGNTRLPIRGANNINKFLFFIDIFVQHTEGKERFYLENDIPKIDAIDVDSFAYLITEEPMGNAIITFTKEKLESSTIAHELGHNMGLSHLFSEESEFYFYKGYTDNIMDYENRERFEVTGNTDKNKHKRKSFFKWQWDIIREQMEAL